ncbi:MAG: Rieske 2Fe-2S domain-containing protein [Caulobacteraceae bacterium]|nr:Rieske 2Fe-2S domain-containing protein [Caulobacteraceae bacterium]
MLAKDDNELLTRVEGDAPMGKLIREYWMPAVRGASLKPGGAPIRVRLCGENLVAFRGHDGKVGLLNEHCPHRLTSLALARNEDNALTCIFHGWKINAKGDVLEMPAEPADRRAALCSRVKAKAYPTHEAGAMVWAYLGASVEPPAFPEFEFNQLPDDYVVPMRAIVPYNWMQGVEAHLDAAHVGILHSGHIRAGNDGGERLSFTVSDLAPDTVTVPTDYGMREAALRPQPDGSTYVRIREVVFPFYTFIATPADQPGQGRASVPVDDRTNAEWYIIWRHDRPITQSERDRMLRGTSGDPDNFASNLPPASEVWGQDRQAMENHWSGFPANIAFEDFVCEAAMGAIADRSQEHLGPSDVTIVQARRALLQGLRGFNETGRAPWKEGFRFPAIRGLSSMMNPDFDWRSVDTAASARLGIHRLGQQRSELEPA